MYMGQDWVDGVLWFFGTDVGWSAVVQHLSSCICLLDFVVSFERLTNYERFAR